MADAMDLRHSDLLHPDQDDSAHQQCCAGDPHRTDRVNGNTQQAKMVECDRAEHLPRDEKREEGRGAELRDQEDSEPNEDGAPNRPPLQANQGMRAAIDADGTGSCKGSASAAMQMTPMK
ncbi:hypothetical protein UB31_16015 [Bradyrhizobium sp. LTSP849]|nr:hypothetical protein UB31_16015 [Bradyrhizobium sp. LTSP849]